MNNTDERYYSLIDKFNLKRETHNNIANVWISFLNKYHNNLSILIKQGEKVIDDLNIDNIDDINEDIIKQLLILFT